MKSHPNVPDAEKVNPRYALLASYWAVGTVALLIVIKTYAYTVSDSAAMLGTLTDSITDAAISIMMLMAVRYSLKPADADHRHGHGKIEGIASLMQGAFMAGAGVFLCFEAVERFINPEIIKDHHVAITVSGIAIILTFLLVAIQKFALSRAPSLAIEADQAHYKTDLLLNGGVIVTLLANLKGAPLWFDPAFALVIAGYFLRMAYKISKRSVDMLMDKEMSQKVRRHIEEIVRQNLNVYGMHDLRTRQAGMRMHISFDVELYPELSLKEAHDIVRDLDHAILEHYPHAEIIIHMDPIGDTDDPRHTVRGIHH
jgi:ferrous-iron efflux pump FieF